MFKIKYIQNIESSLNYIELKNSYNNSYAKIFFNLGGSLQELVLNKKKIINGLHPLSYETSYSSAILFPFANRIKNGTYKFQEKTYKLELNQKDENNALHGLVYNKKFNIVKQKTSREFASITLNYTELEKQKGFPFRYSIILTYTLTMYSLKLDVTINNEDLNSFPFSLGWHPYFCSSDLYNSFLTLKSNKKLSFDNNMIPVTIEDVTLKNDLQIKDKKFDDCYILYDKNVFFKNPDYSIVINSSSKENYLQLYTPNKTNSIAIEPMTGPSNSFNNKLGLQVLNSGEAYNVSWSVKLIINNSVND